jgi:hypothetical protein
LTFRKNPFYFFDAAGGGSCGRLSAVRSGGLVRFSYAESMTDPSFYAPLAGPVAAAGGHRRAPVRGARDLPRCVQRRRGAAAGGPGVTDVIVGFRWPYQVGPDTEPLADKLANLRKFADDVIAKVR